MFSVFCCFFFLPSPSKAWADEMSLADIDNMFDDLGELMILRILHISVSFTYALH